MSQSKKSRRQFLLNSAKAGLAISAISAPVSGLFASATKGIGPHENLFFTGFDQAPLPYSYNALEPSIDAQTMDIHFNKHASAYSKNLKEAAQAEGVDMGKPLEDVLARVSKYSTKLRNNGGGHFNHELFWKSMKAASADAKPSGKLAASIEASFGSLDAFKTQFSDAAKNRFGSGWAWLAIDADKKLRIGSTPNQDNPLMDVSEFKGYPLLGLDVWEHAYYLKYQNKRADYITAWWNVVNWDFIQKRFEGAI
jgi:superoxide dismutase, Fe-Mn family